MDILDNDKLKERAQDCLMQLERALDKLFRTRAACHLRERQRQIMMLMRRGYHTTADMLRADFGGDRINGLDIIAYPAIYTKLKSLTDSDYYRTATPEEQARELACVNGRAGDRTIYMNPSYLSLCDAWFATRQTGASTYSHEYMHILQQVEWEEDGWPNSFLENYSVNIRDAVSENGLTGKLRRLYQKFRHASVDNKISPYSSHSNVTNYLSEEVEMQTRLHELMVFGYAGWRRLPSTKLELWAALKQMGLHAPKEIRKALKTPEGREACKRFRSPFFMDSKVSYVIKNMNAVYDYATFSDRRNYMWEGAYPYIYGNMIELYGDGPGRARMGLGPNPLQAKALVAALNQGIRAQNPPAETQVREMAAAIPVECTQQLLNVLHLNLSRNPRHKAVYLQAAEIFLERPDVREAMNNIVVGPFLPAENNSAFMNSALNGDGEIARLMLQAGYDPFKPKRAQHEERSAPAISDGISLVSVWHFRFKVPPEYVAHYERRVTNMLQHIANTYPDLDQVPSGPFGNPVIGAEGLTIRQIMAKAGIHPQATPEKRPGGMPDSRALRRADI